MNETQEKVWNILCGMTGEEVAQLWTNIYGTQVLDDDDVVHELELQGYEIEDEDEDEDDEPETEYSCTLDGMEVARFESYAEAMAWLNAYDGDQDADFEEVPKEQ